MAREIEASMLTFNKIYSNLYVGSCPTEQSDIIRLSDIGITHIINLQTDYEMKAMGIDWTLMESYYKQHNIHLERVEMDEIDPKHIGYKLQDAMWAMQEFAAVPSVIYIYCSDGLYRAPTVALGYMVIIKGLKAKEAMQLLKQKRLGASPYCDPVDALMEHKKKHGSI